VDKYSIVGWSDGGITGMILAGRYPDRVKKLVLIAANSYETKEDQELLEGTGQKKCLCTFDLVIKCDAESYVVYHFFKHCKMTDSFT